MVQMPRAHRDGVMREARLRARTTIFTRDLIQPSSGVYVLRIGWSATPPADLAQRSEEEVMKSSSFKHRIGKMAESLISTCNKKSLHSHSGRLRSRMLRTSAVRYLQYPILPWCNQWGRHRW